MYVAQSRCSNRPFKSLRLHLVGKMQSVQMEQRVNLKFHVKLGKTTTEALAMLNEVYGSEFLSCTQVFEWFNRFKKKRETAEDDLRPGRPSISKTDDNIQKISPRRSDSQLTLLHRGSDCPS